MSSSPKNTGVELFSLHAEQHEFKGTWWQLNHCSVTVNSVTLSPRSPCSFTICSQPAHSSQCPSPHLSSLYVPIFLSLHHPLLTPGSRWHLPGALTFSHGSPCCSLHVRPGGFMAHIHQRHMPGFMGDGVQTRSLWISLAEADLWAVVGYNGWASLPPSTPTTIPSLLLSPHLPHWFHSSLHTLSPLCPSVLSSLALAASSWLFI